VKIRSSNAKILSMHFRYIEIAIKTTEFLTNNQICLSSVHFTLRKSLTNGFREKNTHLLFGIPSIDMVKKKNITTKIILLIS